MSELEKDLEGVVLANWLRMLEPSIVSTGVRTPSGRYDARGYALGARAAETFLVNSRLLRGDVEMALSIREHFTGTAAHLLSFLGRETRRGGVAVKLPTSVPLETSLEEAFRRRRSVRSYSGDALPLAQLATIIRAAAGLTNPNTSGEDGSAASGHRSVPSGGGLYPVDLHIAAVRVETLPRATFVYDPHRDVLEQTGDESVVDACARLACPTGNHHHRKQGERGLPAGGSALEEHAHTGIGGCGMCSSRRVQWPNTSACGGRDRHWRCPLRKFLRRRGARGDGYRRPSRGPDPFGLPRVARPANSRRQARRR